MRRAGGGTGGGHERDGTVRGGTEGELVLVGEVDAHGDVLLGSSVLHRLPSATEPARTGFHDALSTLSAKRDQPEIPVSGLGSRLFVPGPLQTEDYARAIFSNRVPELPHDELWTLLANRVSTPQPPCTPEKV
ncbi:Scr1 family TA system antitoxin-like transcriptional regulator [Streptomyces sp. NBC_01515]|uniref:Scr1 family TA system antitoxin-like transcriptional regulator n=1 Tax=Streptomyces sp. NBC_01515 TaxID=2903890 RepID=UPI00386692E6